MAQLIFENLETLTQHLFQVDVMPEHLPRTGEKVRIFSEDDRVVYGIVESVSWVFQRETKDGQAYSVFVHVRPTDS